MATPVQYVGSVTQSSHLQAGHHMPIDASNPEAVSASRLLSDYFRVPAGVLAPLLNDGSSASHPGYFNFGPDTICYGRVSGEKKPQHLDGNLEDALACACLQQSAVNLSFNADEAVENIRRERYTAHFREEGNVLNELVRKAYYLVRPLLGVPVRRHLQKMHLRGWENISFPAWPVDSTVERIHRRLLALSLRARGLERVPFVWFWPKGFSSCMIMTHDVEDQAGKEFCGTLMDIDEAGGIRSSFQIIPENRYSATSEFLNSIKARGFEVNVHDLKHDGRLYADHEEFLRRADRINTHVQEFGAEGFRSGILYRNADWYDAFRFSYDMSIPNVGHLDPQRGGCCTVMPYFIGDIVELPLTCTQDYTLFKILGDYSIDLWKRQVNLIKENNGLISFIVHPDYVIDKKAQKIYKSLLEYLAGQRAGSYIWSALPRDVANWWRQRGRMQLVNDGATWRIQGEGSERACVAYAELDGDSVTYTPAN